MKLHNNNFKRHPLRPLILAAFAATMHPAHALEDLYLPGPLAPNEIRTFDGFLGLSTTDADRKGLLLAQRRAALPFSNGPTQAFEPSALGLSTRGQLGGYLYQALITDLNVPLAAAGPSGTDRLTLGTGTTDSSPNLPLLLDLGESDLKVSGTLETQGALFLSTVNSHASSDGMLMDGTSTLDVDSSRTGQVTSAQLIELGGGQAQFKLMLDLNSSLKDGAQFTFLEETRVQNAGGVTGETAFAFDGKDTLNANLLDTSYVINTSAATVEANGQQRVIVTFNRADDEYISKSYTANHPSNDAALKLGIIAANGLALGDMQTALTRLDVNDFGYGNNAANLATEVKRLAPIANNAFLISAFDGVKLVTDAVDYRIAARRGNWSGHSGSTHSFWLRSVGAKGNSSGSVPVATPGAQDTAGHDGFVKNASGVVMGYDQAVSARTNLGASFAYVSTNIRQRDDRVGEDARLAQHVWSVYSQWSDMTHFATAALKYGDGRILGVRKTAIDRVAAFDVPIKNTELAVTVGRRFDLSNGRSAISPYLRLADAHYEQQAYRETGAGDLSLQVSRLKVEKASAELGVRLSHKGRFSGVKALTVFDLALGSDLSVSDQTVRARYTGETDTTHPSFTGFETPAEAWAREYVQLKWGLQMELAPRVMLKGGVDAELRQSRQNYGADLSLNWVF